MLMLIMLMLVSIALYGQKRVEEYAEDGNVPKE